MFKIETNLKIWLLIKISLQICFQTGSKSCPTSTKMNSRRIVNSTLRSAKGNSISLRMIQSSGSNTLKLKYKKSREVPRKKHKRLNLSVCHAFSAIKYWQQRSSRTDVTSALCKVAKIAFIRNIHTPNRLTRRQECVIRDAYAGYARLSSISKK